MSAINTERAASKAAQTRNQPTRNKPACNKHEKGHRSQCATGARVKRTSRKAPLRLQGARARKCGRQAADGLARGLAALGVTRKCPVPAKNWVGPLGRQH
eukprot:13327162-Alexandrium_andersonii.AAC.1